MCIRDSIRKEGGILLIRPGFSRSRGGDDARGETRRGARRWWTHLGRACGVARYSRGRPCLLSPSAPALELFFEDACHAIRSKQISARLLDSAPGSERANPPDPPESPGRRARDPGCFEPALRVELPRRPVERSRPAKGRPDPPRGARLARFFPATQRAVGRAAQKPPLTTRRSTRGAPGADRARARPARAFRRRPRTSSPRARPATRATPREPRNDLRARRRTPGVRCADPTHRANPLPAGLWRDRSVRFSHPKPDRRRARTSSNAR